VVTVAVAAEAALISYQKMGASMDISRKLGILIFCGVPAIVGGGIVMAAFDSMTALWIYEALLVVTAGALVSR
jgi:hypothetical protein